MAHYEQHGNRETKKPKKDKGRTIAQPSKWSVREAVDAKDGDVTLTGNTALYSSRKNCASRKISDLAYAKAGIVGLINDYTQLM
jgi:hypothetical protein